MPDTSVDTIVKTVISFLESQGKLSLLPKVVDKLSKKASSVTKEHTAFITSAQKLSPKDVGAIKDYVSANFGHVENVETKIDDSLIAGFIVRIGDNIIDRSLKGKVNSLKDKLIFASASEGTTK